MYLDCFAPYMSKHKNHPKVTSAFKWNFNSPPPTAWAGAGSLPVDIPIHPGALERHQADTTNSPQLTQIVLQESET